METCRLAIRHPPASDWTLPACLLFHKRSFVFHRATRCQHRLRVARGGADKAANALPSSELNTPRRD
eukprot:365454-Chlamydomonas_euryale.AAC.6